MKFLSKNLKLIQKIIGWIQIIGGIAGLGLMAYLMLHTDAINGPVLLLLLIGVALFIFSIYCGNALLSPLTTNKGIILSLINQALQFIQWSMIGYGISYSSPVQILIGLKGSVFDISFGLTSTFNMAFNSGDSFRFEINIVAIFLFVVLIEMYRIHKQGNLAENDLSLAEEYTSPEAG
jgi:hypothetical protein